ncbi:alpha/beta hydrolase-fold protein [Pedobacter sp. B4-66]|uniref:alpha/beta hydrolase-fold protein n=1 Tax=Pedobacter sp. B4-66 TaxID=2817280 RepID=UPI001BDB3913|nr:alpha/beta hydrolase-fold protein [Pedobacter sp. B4-66]
MKKCCLLVLLLINFCGAKSQIRKAVEIGKVDSLYSKILKEERTITVYLPDNFNPTFKYPVAYVLDGESFFHFYTGVSSFLANNSIIPDMIIVGITNTDRSRDFTLPSDSSSNYKPNGGGEKFISFLGKELIPFIEEKYNVAPFRLVLGHSVAGLLVANILVKYPALFNSYIALDPAIWWKNSDINKNAPNFLKPNSLKNRIFFLAMANSNPVGISNSRKIANDTTGYTNAMKSVVHFDELLNKHKETGLQNTFKYYPNENHNSVPLIATYDALKTLFSFYKRPGFQILTDSSATVLENHYKMLSEKMGYTILPSTTDISGLAWRSKVLDKNYKRAKMFLEMHIRLYPNDANGYIEMARYYDELNDQKSAAKFLEQAKQKNK